MKKATLYHYLICIDRKEQRNSRKTNERPYQETMVTMVNSRSLGDSSLFVWVRYLFFVWVHVFPLHSRGQTLKTPFWSSLIWILPHFANLCSNLPVTWCATGLSGLHPTMNCGMQKSPGSNAERLNSCFFFFFFFFDDWWSSLTFYHFKPFPNWFLCVN